MYSEYRKSYMLPEVCESVLHLQ